MFGFKDAPAATNYSLFTVPAYMILAMLPHAYSVALLSTRQPSKEKKKDEDNKNKSSGQAPFETRTASLYNATSPRTPSSSAHYAAHLPSAVYQRYERCRAAHANMLENSAFVFSAVLAGILTKLEPSSMNVWCGCYLLSRMLYLVSYISISSLRWSTLRTLWFLVGNGFLFKVYWEAGWKVVRGDF